MTEVSVEAGKRDGSRSEDPREIEKAIVTMRLSGGTLAVLDAAWLHPSGYDMRIELLTERAAVTGGLSPRTPAIHVDWAAPTDPWHGYLDRFEAAYRAELAAFLACCRGVRPPSSSARDGLEAMRVAVAATISHVERRRVAWTKSPAWRERRWPDAGCAARCRADRRDARRDPREPRRARRARRGRCRCLRGRRRWRMLSGPGSRRSARPSKAPTRS